MHASIQAFVQDLQDMEQVGPHIVHQEVFPGSPAAVQDVHAPWPAEIQSLLETMHIHGLYSHQARAIDAVRNGRHTVIATPTASGKSLIYSLPVLERIARNPMSRSLFLFPLKALAQDQLRGITDMTAEWTGADRPRAAVYDGDTPAPQRAAVRRQLPHMLLTNPEMLHLSLLSSHRKWAGLWSNLDFVVVDEVHTYRGVMGSNMAWVFRRLLRICAEYGARPTFVFCSATIGNPGQLAQNLTGLPVQVVEKSGAPQGQRYFLFINPLHGAAQSALHLLQASLDRGLRTIVYTQSRKMTELIALWAKRRCPEQAKRISAYRSGFLPRERREIEDMMSQGEILAVIATSALELGIDIGGLDVCILVGYPGSIMATWQRGGRVGRQQQDSLVALIGHEDNLDQYFMAHPQRFFQLPPEDAVINPHNPVIMDTHIQCAASDKALHREEPMLAESGVEDAVSRLLDRELLGRSRDGQLLYALDPQVAGRVNLRGSGRNLSILDQSQGRVIGSIDHFRACQETHPGAVYLHRGKTYVIEDLQAENGAVLARPDKVNYYTRVRTEKETEILSQEASAQIGEAQVSCGRLRVTVHIIGYEKRLTRGHRLVDVVPLDLDPFVFETDGLWLQISSGIRERIEAESMHFMGGIHALEHAMIGLMPLLVLADRNDLGGIAQPYHQALGTAAVFVYDGIPGGVGLTRQAFTKVRSLLEQTLHAVTSCSCEAGCPACVHSPKCGAGNRPLDKTAAVHILSLCLGRSVSTGQTTGARVREAGARQQKLGGSEQQVRFAVFDLETQRSAQEVGGWNRASEMGVSAAVLYDSQSKEFVRYTEEEVPKLISQLHEVDLVIGFNVLRFDYQVLRAYTRTSLQRLPTLDLLQSIRSRLGYGLSLDHVAGATLGTSKIGNGMQAVRWWKQGKMEKLLDYCQEDVALTLGLYMHGRDNGHILFQNKAGKLVKLAVDWPGPIERKDKG
ncbi:DEAD/DEAH box helicase [Desulfovermiculus halophilus]|uniref:DEAD/DEAH box helicase n=1 Tax=Desulfovermiculus halophilus TaxID=339722 RepID=UPI000489E137|nr:DEAD/DEAH box helicase [Desulfovermiculus halophilus]